MKIQLLIPYVFQGLLAGSGLSLWAAPVHASILLLEDFETDGEGTRYVSTHSFTDGVDDYFIRTDGYTEASGVPLYSGYGGSYFWAAEDVDGPANPEGLALLDFSGVELGGFERIVISLDVAAGSLAAYDSVNDFALVQYRVDGAAWKNVFAFQNDGSRYNSALYQDFDYDGIGEGDPLGMEFRTFSSGELAINGSLLDLRIDVFMDANLEAVAFDNITITAVPEPAGMAVAVGLMSLIPLIYRRFSTRSGAGYKA